MNIQELHNANMEGFKQLLNDASVNRKELTLINAQVELLIEHFSQEHAKDTDLKQEKLKIEYLTRDLERMSQWCLQNKFRIVGNDLICSGVRGQIIQLLKKIETWNDWHNLNSNAGVKGDLNEIPNK